MRRRRRMMQAPVPYDRRVEYLESTGKGMAYIAFPFKVASRNVDYYLDVEFSVSSFGEASLDPAPVRITNGTIYYSPWDTVGVGFSAAYFTTTTQDKKYWQLSIADFVPNKKYRVIKDNWQVSWDGITVPTRTQGGYIVDAASNLFLFKCVKNYNWDTGIQIRIYRGHAKVAGGPEVDFFPVRKDGVGYMYDRISKKLHGNEGPEPFIIGPDLALGGGR